jgi:hypothetical protein
MLATQDVIELLAKRIERAYGLHRHGWNPGCSTPRVWGLAASTLIEAHRADPTLPLDPELYVASQTRVGSFADPWKELTQPSSVRRYRFRVRRIIRALKDELCGEVQRAERLVGRGTAIEDILLEESRYLSPLGRFIAAQRAGRYDLAKQLFQGAAHQHRSCPLYREASHFLLSPELYPVEISADSIRTQTPHRHPPQLPQLN